MENQGHRQLIERIKLAHPEARLEYSFDDVTKLYQSQIIDESQNAKGFGESLNYQEALIKCYAEYIERLAFRESKARNSNGFAAHTSDDLALKAARCELVERDALMLMWLGKRAPYWLDTYELGLCCEDKSIAMLEILNDQRLDGLEYRVGVVAKTGPYVTLIGALTSKNGEFAQAVDTVCAENLAEAIHSVLESLLSLSYIVRENLKAGLRELEYSQVHAPLDHLHYHLHPKRYCLWFWQGSEEVALFEEFEIETQVKGPLENLALDLFVARATSEDAQPLFFGPTTLEKINLARFNLIFPGLAPNLEEIHPLA